MFEENPTYSVPERKRTAKMENLQKNLSVVAVENEIYDTIYAAVENHQEVASVRK